MLIQSICVKVAYCEEIFAFVCEEESDFDNVSVLHLGLDSVAANLCVKIMFYHLS